MTTWLIISVDVETPQTPLRNGLFEEACFDPIVDGVPLGYSYILDVLRRYQLSATFFVNIFESALWGEALLGKICKDIHSVGSEVGLHTHPEWAYDPKRIHMWQYSLEEQKKILSDGVHMIKNWLPGYKLISHRAGAYGLNQDTIKALKQLEIPVDSSMYFGHPNSKYIWSKNDVVFKAGILEIPVTGYYRRKKFLRMPFGRLSEFIKTDIDWSTQYELESFVEAGLNQKINIINLFAHSYSFVQFEDDYSKMFAHAENIDKFEKFLGFVNTIPDLKVVAIRDFYQLFLDNSDDSTGGMDFVPVIHQSIDFGKKLRNLIPYRVEN